MAKAAESLNIDAGTIRDLDTLHGAAGNGPEYGTAFNFHGELYTIEITLDARSRANAKAATESAHQREAEAFRLGQKIALEAAQDAIGRVTVDPYSAADQGALTRP